ncbi:MAG: hypothetical protein KKC64_04335, partial [Spirochaetes bacterium]|nr:hypothetical protein [Spirochaetota bacterium]
MAHAARVVNAVNILYSVVMNDALFVVTLATIGVILVWLFYTLIFRPLAGRQEHRNSRFVKDSRGVEHDKTIGTRSCPVCSMKLSPGMSVRSKLFTEKGNDRIMHVFGCPYCWPDNTAHQRTCPVCHQMIPRNGYLISRYFEDASHRHVHVLGCSG